MQVYPYILYRSGGLSFDQLTKAPKPSTEHTEQLLHLLTDKQDQQATLNALLTNYTRNLTNYQLKEWLLNLRRDIYNDRQFSSNAIRQFHEAGLEKVFETISTYERVLKELEMTKQNWEDYFNGVVHQEKSYWQELSGTPALFNGLLLSSHSLLARLASYQQTPLEAFRKKERQTERAALQYLTRIGAKSSPFSSFGRVGAWSLKEKKVVNSNDQQLWLNNHLLAHWQELLSQYPPFYHQLPVQLNPSIYKVENDFVFLLNSRNVESVQHIVGDAVTGYFYSLIKQSAVLSFQRLLLQAAQVIDAPIAELEDYIIGLIKAGFLEWQWPVSGTDAQWIEPFQKMLRSMDRDALLDECLSLGEELHHLLKDYPSVGVLLKKQLLRNTTERLSAFTVKMTRIIFSEKKALEDEATNAHFQRFEVRTFPLKAERLLFEDCSKQLSPPKAIDELQELLPIIQQMIAFAAQLQPLGMNKLLTDFYKKQYPNRVSVPLLEFYEVYYHEKPQITDEEAKELESLQRQWLEQIGTLVVVKEDCIYLTISDLEKVSTLISMEWNQKLKSPTAYGALLQPFQGNGQLHAYLDTCLLGYGRMWSRFLGLFPSDLTKVQREWNQKESEDEIWVENRDASFFNANVHPPLLVYELAIPGGHNDLPTDRQIPIAQLLVKLDEGGDILQLWESEQQKSLTVFDLGFEGILGRSPMYQLLSAFGKPSPQLAIIPQLLSHQFGRVDTEGIVHQPRIYLEERLVLQRRAWYIPVNQLPKRQANESEGMYYLRMQQWRRNLQIPSKVFITLAPPAIKSPSSSDAVARQSDDYKPRYLDFESPAMLRLWIYLLERVTTYLKIEEQLPTADELFGSSNQRFVMEWVVQWKAE